MCCYYKKKKESTKNLKPKEKTQGSASLKSPYEKSKRKNHKREKASPNEPHDNNQHSSSH